MEKRYDHDVLLKWRTQLTDLEIDTFIPIFHGRLEALEDIFKQMLATLNSIRSDSVYLASIEQVLNPNKIRQQPGVISAGILYCDSIGEQINRDFLARIDLLKTDLTKAADFRSFSKFINLMDQLCGSITQNKMNLFLYSLKPYAHLINHETKTVITTPPIEYSLILRPFDVWLINLDQIALGTSGTIETWRKTQTDWKTQYLAFRSNESNARNSALILRVNVATVFLAVSLSFAFLFFPDILGLRKENSELKAQVSSLQDNLRHAQAAQMKEKGN